MVCWLDSAAALTLLKWDEYLLHWLMACHETCLHVIDSLNSLHTWPDHTTNKHCFSFHPQFQWRLTGRSNQSLKCPVDRLTFSWVKSLIFVDIAWSQSVLSAAVQNWRILALTPSKAKTSKQLDLEECRGQILEVVQMTEGEVREVHTSAVDLEFLH